MSFLDNTRKPDGLSSEKICAGGQIQLVFLRVGDAVADDLVPYFNHRRNVGGSIGPLQTACAAEYRG